jgi:nicotinate phosphoribosyltransferase
MAAQTTVKITGIENLADNYRKYTDKYFLRSKDILKEEKINPLVRYQVFARHDSTELKGIDEAVDFIRGVAGDKVRIYSMKEGESYYANEPIMKLEGRVQDLIDLETVYLGILSGNLTGDINLHAIREKAKAIKKAAKDKPVFYFGARHFHPNLDEKLAGICYEEGFVGTSTDIGAKAWKAKGLGTIPHALVLAYEIYIKENCRTGNATVEAAKGFDRYIDKTVPRIVLNCTFNREITDTIESAKALPDLKGTRIDTCGENFSEGSQEIVLPELDVHEKYLRGRGVTIAGVWALRRGLDESGFGNLEITVSSGFNEGKTDAFMEADRVYQKIYRKPLFNSIGTGSLADPFMTTSDICAYFSEKDGKWKPLSKTGRRELYSNRLEEVK